MKKIISLCCCFVSLLASVSAFSVMPCFADPASDLDPILAHLRTEGDPNVSVVNLDLNVPDSPAFSILGLTPDKVTKPTALRDIVTSLLNGTDIRGNVQSGVAVDISPFRLLNAQESKEIAAGKPLHGLTIADYRRDYAKQLLYRTELSVATAKGSSSADLAARVALGLTVTLYNDGDPILDNTLLKSLQFAAAIATPTPPNPPDLANGHTLTLDEVVKYRALVEAFAKKAPGPPKETPIDEPVLDPNASQPQLRQYVSSLQDYATARGNDAQSATDANRQDRNRQLALDAFKVAKARNWNASSWTVGYAPSWASRTGAFDQLSTNTQGIWTSLGIRAGHDGQLLLHVHHLGRELVPDAANDGSLVRQNSDMYGGRIRVGAEAFGLALEGARYHDKPEGSPSIWYTQISIGAEARITKDYWLALSVGGDNKATHHDSFVMGSVKWGFNTGATSH